MMTQNQRVMEHFKNHGTLTQAEAAELYGIWRLSARVNDLINAGHDIRKVMVEDVNRYGGTVRFARYYLAER